MEIEDDDYYDDYGNDDDFSWKIRKTSLILL